jgi:ATP-dependent protease HslVU (ClpYQ) ATPase subunit
MMELLLQDVLFEAPEGAQGKIEFDEKAVRTKLEDYVANLERAKMMV